MIFHWFQTYIDPIVFFLVCFIVFFVFIVLAFHSVSEKAATIGKPVPVYKSFSFWVSCFFVVLMAADLFISLIIY